MHRDEGALGPGPDPSPARWLLVARADPSDYCVRRPVLVFGIGVSWTLLMCLLRAVRPAMRVRAPGGVGSDWTGDRSRWYCAPRLTRGPPTARSIQRRPPARLRSPCMSTLGPTSRGVLRAHQELREPAHRVLATRLPALASRAGRSLQDKRSSGISPVKYASWPGTQEMKAPKAATRGLREPVRDP